MKKYEKIINDIILKIQTGIFKEGEQLYTEKEIKEIYKEVCVNKINIINIEYRQFDNLSDENYIEKVYIFDKDNCEI